MLQDALYLIAALIALGIVYMLCDIAYKGAQAWQMRRRYKRDFADMQARIEFWQKYDRQFGRDQRRIRNGAEKE